MNFHTFFDALEVTENNGTDLALVEVKSKTKSAIGKLEQLVSHRARQAFNVCNTVTGIDHVTNLGL